jgi:hypothetical protein
MQISPGTEDKKWSLWNQPGSMDSTKVSDLKLAVVKKIESFVAGGGFLFAMCSATDTYDIALAAEGVDIVGAVYDGDPPDPNAHKSWIIPKHLPLGIFVCA